MFLFKNFALFIIFACSTIDCIDNNAVQVPTVEVIKPKFKQTEYSERLHKGRDIFKYMDLSISPCDDFYEFACGNWGKYRIQSLSTPETNLQLKIDIDLQDMIEEEVTATDDFTARQIKIFYKSCVSAQRNSILQQTFFSDLIKNNSGFPAVPGSNWAGHHHSYNWQQVVSQLYYNYDIQILVGIHVDTMHFNPHIHENSIYIGEPETIIPPELCSAAGTKRVDISEREYEFIEKEVAENLRMWLSIDMPTARHVAADIVTLEFDLCQGMSKGSEVKPKYERRPLHEWTTIFNQTFDFSQFVRTSFGVDVYKPVFLGPQSYFEHLIKTLSDYNTTTLANYVMYRALSTLSFPVDDQPIKRPHHCLSIMKRHFSKIISMMYLQEVGFGTSKEELQILFNTIKGAFKRTLYSEWIEDRTRRVGIDKLDEITFLLPTYKNIQLTNLNFEPTNYWGNLQKVLTERRQFRIKSLNASGQQEPSDLVEYYATHVLYKPYLKRIEIGRGVLQSPYYEEFYPQAIRYATIGQMIGREFAKAFDEHSWISEFLGIPNWDLRTADQYRNRTECFRQQLSNYLYDKPDVFQNATKLRELIAISGGLNVAFSAYLDWLTYKNPSNNFDYTTLSKETLPELNFSNTQLFFISYAQMYCRTEKKSNTSFLMSPLQRHTIERFHVNGPLLNNEEFSREFHCAPGAEMDSVDKCIIY